MQREIGGAHRGQIAQLVEAKRGARKESEKKKLKSWQLDEDERGRGSQSQPGPPHRRRDDEEAAKGGKKKKKKKRRRKSPW